MVLGRNSWELLELPQERQSICKEIIRYVYHDYNRYVHGHQATNHRDEKGHAINLRDIGTNHKKETREKVETKKLTPATCSFLPVNQLIRAIRSDNIIDG